VRGDESAGHRSPGPGRGANFKVVDPVKSVVAIENVYSAIDQIAQTALRKVVGQHTLDETLSETDEIALDIQAILDVTTIDWGVQVTLVELKDIQLPETVKRAMAREGSAAGQAEPQPPIPIPAPIATAPNGIFATGSRP
jgi:membrane protease subunit (stomatin/prohibitin family)